MSSQIPRSRASQESHPLRERLLKHTTHKTDALTTSTNTMTSTITLDELHALCEAHLMKGDLEGSPGSVGARSGSWARAVLRCKTWSRTHKEKVSYL